MVDNSNTKDLKDSITDVPGVKVGHSQDLTGGTGCTVVLFEEGAVTGVDVRGGAPGTRETDALNPVNLVGKAHAIYLSGGSAFGLDGTAGVMRYMEELGIGFDVGVTKVPIIPAAVLFDLTVGDFRTRPDAKMGYEACLNANEINDSQGNIGAGTGATIGKVLGYEFCMKSGLGTASLQCGDLIIGAIVAVNCFGDVYDPHCGKIIAGALSHDRKSFLDTIAYLKNPSLPENNHEQFPANTTIGAIATNAKLTKAEATKIAMMAHNGFARTIVPVHTMFDGDTIFCSGTGKIDASVNLIGILAAEVMINAVINAVKNTKPLFGRPCYQDLYKEKQ